MQREKLIRYLIIGGVFISVMLILIIRADLIEKNYAFRGVIRQIHYTDKKAPIVVVCGQDYIMTFPDRNFTNNLQIGDSLIKEKGSRRYKLIKFKTHEAFYSE